MFKDSQKGATLYFAIVIMSILLAAVFSISSVIFVQIKTIKGMGNSVLAYYAADTGAEAALDYLYSNNVPAGGRWTESLGGSGYQYDFYITQPIGGTLKDVDGVSLPTTSTCTAQYYCIKSIGSYSDVKRAVELKG